MKLINQADCNLMLIELHKEILLFKLALSKKDDEEIKKHINDLFILQVTQSKEVFSMQEASNDNTN